jgi:hypothetical protein
MTVVLSVIAMLALVQPILTGIGHLQRINHSPGALMAEAVRDLEESAKLLIEG